MYGLLLENLAEYIKVNYGEEKWDEIRRLAGIDSPSFSVHQVYPENLLCKLAKKAQQVLGVSERQFMDQMGVCFVGFVGQYGYDRVLSVLGRHMRDFLNGLDNLHEYLKFSYPRMKAPSFICENETKQGLTLHYRSKRRGFVFYTMGQIREVARHFYHKEMHIELVGEEILFDTVHVTFQLTFDNRAFTQASLAMIREERHLPISASVLFEIFPFCIVFGSDMTVRSIGNSLMVILPDLVGKKITNCFDLVRPLIAFKYQTILNRTNNIFELVTVEPVPENRQADDQSKLELLILDTEAEDEKTLRLKGQMIYMDNWRMIMFLGTPVMPDLTALINTGLYINDLSMHDFSRDLMLAGTQQSVELKLALDQEQQKSKKLEESMRKLDEEMRRTDELLYQMIPKQVADRLRRGENPIDTCEMFDSVSILFSDVVTFTEICSRISPMEVVSMLNAMYSIFDTLTERNNVYKVETIGDAYMVVSGAPEKDPNHAEKVCDMALDMVEAITDLKDPSTGTHLKIRVGVHSGAVVAGIVGLKMPRYCLFGDSVNTASRMESTSGAMKVHISHTTKELLGPNYKLADRGEIEVKGKGQMKTYWLEDREYRTKLPPNATSSNTSLMPAAAAAPNVLAIGPPAPTAQTTQMVSVEPKVLAVPAIMPAGSVSADSSTASDATMVAIVGLAETQQQPVPPVSRPSSAAGLDRILSVSAQVTAIAHLPPTAPAPAEIDRRIYSPITFQDVAMRSIVNSPSRSQTSGRAESRSNSTGQVFMHSPSNIFGALINDTEEFFEDIQLHRTHPFAAHHMYGSTTSSPAFSPTPPFRTNSTYRKHPANRTTGGASNAGSNSMAASDSSSSAAVCTRLEVLARPPPNLSTTTESTTTSPAIAGPSRQQHQTAPAAAAAETSAPNNSGTGVLLPGQCPVTQSALPPPVAAARHGEKQLKAFEQLDIMLEEYLKQDMPLCTYAYTGPRPSQPAPQPAPPPSQSRMPTTSQSDGHICAKASTAATSKRSRSRSSWRRVAGAASGSTSGDQQMTVTGSRSFTAGSADSGATGGGGSSSANSTPELCSCGAPLGAAPEQRHRAQHGGRHARHHPHHACAIL